MIIKKFTAKTEKEAVEIAQKELGENVVIMNVKEVKKKGLMALLTPKQVEVTVALEDEKETQRYNRIKSELQKESSGGKEADVNRPRTVANLSASSLSSNSSIEKKLDSLQILLESQFQKEEYAEKRAADRAMADTEEKETALNNANAFAESSQKENTEQDKFFKLLYNTMIDNEVDEKYANQIMDEVDRNRKPNTPFDHILASIYQKMVLKFGKADGILPSEKGARQVFFIGPTGVGKTTTIAKIASYYVLEEKKKVAMLTTDTYRIAATEQLHTYANILEIPFRVIYTEEELVNTVELFKEYDYIFIDTTGHSHKNEDQMDCTEKFLKATEDILEQQVFLVVSATTKYKDLKKIVDKYTQVTEYQLIFTKLDETTAYGNLYNIKLYTNAPISYVTYGQNVPEDIERFQPQKVVKQILGGK